MGTLGAGARMSSTNSATSTFDTTLRQDINTQCCNSGFLNQLEIHTKSRASSRIPTCRVQCRLGSGHLGLQVHGLCCISWFPFVCSHGGTWEKFRHNR